MLCSEYFSHVEICRSSCPSPSESSSSKDTDNSEPEDPIYALRHTSHHWPSSHERVICILKRFYDINFREVRQIFNKHFEAELPSGVITQGLSEGAIVARWNKILGDEDNHSYDEVFIETNLFDRQKFSGIHRELEQTAAKVGVELIARTWEDKHKILERREPPKRLKRKRRVSTDNHGVLGPKASQRPGETDDDERSRAPKRKAVGTNRKTLGLRTNRRENRRLVAPPSSWASYTGKRLFRNPTPPRLGFRFFCSDCSFGLNDHKTHGFRAGLYQDIERFPVVPPPIDPKMIEYHDSVRRHVSREITTATPLISVTQTFWGALNRSLRHEDCEASIAVIDLQNASQGDAEYPQRYCSARSVIRAYDIKISGKGYKGNAEWFLWGEIARSSIISVISVRDLVDSFPGLMDGEEKDPFRFSVLQSTKSSTGARKALERQNYKPILSAFYGESVGKLLRRLVTRSYVGYAAKVILSNWGFPPTWRENFKFMGAIYRGYYYTNQNIPEKELEFIRSLIQQTTKTPQSPFRNYLHNHSEPTFPPRKL